MDSSAKRTGEANGPTGEATGRNADRDHHGREDDQAKGGVLPAELPREPPVGLRQVEQPEPAAGHSQVEKPEPDKDAAYPAQAADPALCGVHRLLPPIRLTAASSCGPAARTRI